MNDDMYVAEAVKLANELGLNWNTIVANTNMCNYVRMIALQWVKACAEQIVTETFWSDWHTLIATDVRDKKKMFTILGFPMPAQISKYPNLFFDFINTLRDILALVPKPS